MKFIFATLHVKNLEESIQFYENIVGMKLARRFPGGLHTEIAFMADGPAEIELICNTEESLLYMENVRHWGFPWKIWTRRWGT